MRAEEGEKIFAVEYYVCVCVCIKLSLLQGKIKIYINTQFSESDIKHKELPGHRRGSEVQLLGRRRKEKL